MVVQCSDVMRLLPCCVDVAKCLLNVHHNQNPDPTIADEVLRLKGKPCDSLLESYLRYVVVMYAKRKIKPYYEMTSHLNSYAEQILGQDVLTHCYPKGRGYCSFDLYQVTYRCILSTDMQLTRQVL